MPLKILSVIILFLVCASVPQLAAAAEKVRIEPPSENIEKFFNAFNRDTLYLVEDFYDAGVEFHDPIVNISGRDRLRRYYEGMYEGIDRVRFDFKGEIKEGADHVVFWTMVLQTKKMNKGKPISVDGNSHIRFGGPEGKAIYHRDYFDVGAMVYEHVPVVGWMTGYVKGKLKKHAQMKDQ
ncbi:MAG: nuclear transport factor 2 family protein [Candidatus Omnitrophica bacterium]|nr:nuclear transport factor 2 family protein [Candidatus Omnitrophota bacterium]MCB9720474.1 nuclear transport factor 2 family protein [Candidatus Omnitrophota bacterium]